MHCLSFNHLSTDLEEQIRNFYMGHPLSMQNINTKRTINQIEISYFPKALNTDPVRTDPKLCGEFSWLKGVLSLQILTKAQRPLFSQNNPHTIVSF